MKTIQKGSKKHVLLQMIYKYAEEYNGPPNHRERKWFAEQSGMPSNQIGNLKSDLMREGYIDPNMVVTEKGKKILQQLNLKEISVPFAVLVTTIRVQGKVSAGPISPNSDGVMVNLDTLDQPSDKTIDVPNIVIGSDIFALEVEGNSMREEGILPGDYVLVEAFNDSRLPQEQEMIVTKYLHPEASAKMERNFGQIDEEGFVGPTLKILVQKIKGARYQLGWRKDNNGNPWVIETKELRPIGRVVGVYRDVLKQTQDLL